MFREKYKADNHLIVPDESLISSLAEKMKSYEEPNTSTIHIHKNNKRLHIIIKAAGVLASCICVIAISATAFYLMEGGVGMKKMANVITDDAKELSKPPESFDDSYNDTTGNTIAEDRIADSSLGIEQKIESSKQKKKDISRTEIITDSEVNNIVISLDSDSDHTSISLTDSLNINKFTTFINTLYNNLDRSILIDVAIDESSGDIIETTFNMEDGSKRIVTIFNDSYFKMDGEDWLPLEKASITLYHSLISEVDSMLNRSEK